MSTLNRVGIYGMGNVGSALVMELAAGEPTAQRVEIASRNHPNVLAAILDAASAYPDQVGNFSVVEQLEGEYDIVVITGGEQPNPNTSQADMLGHNTSIAQKALISARCDMTIVVGSPIDQLTERLSDSSDFMTSQVVGFGGELDRARVRYALRMRGQSQEPVYVIGEHGPRAIPVYKGEKGYGGVKEEVGSVLRSIKKATGKARNLATGVQLARLLRTVAGDEPQIMCISYADDNFEDGLGVTWPREINGFIVRDPLNLFGILGPQAQQDFEQLLIDRRANRR